MKDGCNGESQSQSVTARQKGVKDGCNGESQSQSVTARQKGVKDGESVSPSVIAAPGRSV